MHIVLIGDSILDNKPYVNSGESVEEILKAEFPNDKVTLLAVDGHLSTDVHAQLVNFPEDATHVFVSCGGNDALNIESMLQDRASTVDEALEKLTAERELFRRNYTSAIDAIIKKHLNVSVLTIYNKVPGYEKTALTALALFNEVILEELASRQLPIIDLRVIFNDDQDYSPVSPIEPSLYGGKKIVARMKTLVENQFEPGIWV